jgi:hypothetical protein
VSSGYRRLGVASCVSERRDGSWRDTSYFVVPAGHGVFARVGQAVALDEIREEAPTSPPPQSPPSGAVPSRSRAPPASASSVRSLRRASKSSQSWLNLENNPAFVTAGGKRRPTAGQARERFLRAETQLARSSARKRSVARPRTAVLPRTAVKPPAVRGGRSDVSRGRSDASNDQINVSKAQSNAPKASGRSRSSGRTFGRDGRALNGASSRDAERRGVRASLALETRARPSSVGASDRFERKRGTTVAHRGPGKSVPHPPSSTVSSMVQRRVQQRLRPKGGLPESDLKAFPSLDSLAAAMTRQVDKAILHSFGSPSGQAFSSPAEQKQPGADKSPVRKEDFEQHRMASPLPVSPEKQELRRAMAVDYLDSPPKRAVDTRPLGQLSEMVPSLAPVGKGGGSLLERLQARALARGKTLSLPAEPPSHTEPPSQTEPPSHVERPPPAPQMLSKQAVAQLIVTKPLSSLSEAELTAARHHGLVSDLLIQALGRSLPAAGATPPKPAAASPPKPVVEQSKPKASEPLPTSESAPAAEKVVPLDSEGSVPAAAEGGWRCIVTSYAGMCEMGVHPGQPYKPNQDAIVMEEAPEGRSDALLLCVFDGHGDHGHFVSEGLKEGVSQRVFAYSDEQLLEDPGRCLTEALLETEKELIANEEVDTELSGSTAVCCLVQGDKVTIANVVSFEGWNECALFNVRGRRVTPERCWLRLTGEHWCPRTSPPTTNPRAPQRPSASSSREVSSALSGTRTGTRAPCGYGARGRTSLAWQWRGPSATRQARWRGSPRNQNCLVWCSRGGMRSWWLQATGCGSL